MRAINHGRSVLRAALGLTGCLLIWGCTQVIGADWDKPSKSGPAAGSGGAAGDASVEGSVGGTGSTAQGGSGGTAGAGGTGVCNPNNCPGSDTECATRVCKSGACAMDYAPSTKVLQAQVAGDCKKVMCDGAGQTIQVPDDLDRPNDNKPCTDDVCTGGVPSNPNTASGTPCGGNNTKCDGNGNCSGCTQASDCPQASECATWDCPAGTCVSSPAAEGSVCHVSQAPNAPCFSCQAGACLNVQAGEDPNAQCTGGSGAEVCNGSGACACSDTVKNWGETDVNCGGPACLPCADGKGCLAGSDCLGGACKTDGTCCTPESQAKTCGGKCGMVANNCGQQVDCGGCTPPATCNASNACVTTLKGNGESCKFGPECTSGHCWAGQLCCSLTCDGVCEACNDNGVGCKTAYSDPTCPGTGQMCAAPGSCLCSDGALTPTYESDVDCGKNCPKCERHKKCTGNADCQSAECCSCAGENFCVNYANCPSDCP
ncbi:MAG: hypothetical protein HY898_14085 [Deltaproteobacteria bacterium]|nr:hypothetical protein [Deltaproteobacteria bacterium]